MRAAIAQDCWRDHCCVSTPLLLATMPARRSSYSVARRSARANACREGTRVILRCFHNRVMPWNKDANVAMAATFQLPCFVPQDSASTARPRMHSHLERALNYVVAVATRQPTDVQRCTRGIDKRLEKMLHHLRVKAADPLRRDRQVPPKVRAARQVQHHMGEGLQGVVWKGGVGEGLQGMTWEGGVCAKGGGRSQRRKPSSSTI